VEVTHFWKFVKGILNENKPFIISMEFAQSTNNEKLGTHLLALNIKSCILAPVIKMV
jgi:hypothetical protein